MIDGYIIQNRKARPIIKIFILNICIIISLVIWGINTLEYQSFFHIHSKIIKIDSYYFLEVLVPVKEVNKITKQNNLLIGKENYNYSIYKTEDTIIYKNNTNYLKLYLKVANLKKDYLINNYRLNIKIPVQKQKIIKFF